MGIGGPHQIMPCIVYRRVDVDLGVKTLVENDLFLRPVLQVKRKSARIGKTGDLPPGWMEAWDAA